MHADGNRHGFEVSRVAALVLRIVFQKGSARRHQHRASSHLVSD